jgi:hypothetical protein
MGRGLAPDAEVINGSCMYEYLLVTFDSYFKYAYSSVLWVTLPKPSAHTNNRFSGSFLCICLTEYNINKQTLTQSVIVRFRLRTYNMSLFSMPQIVNFINECVVTIWDKKKRDILYVRNRKRKMILSKFVYWCYTQTYAKKRPGKSIVCVRRYFSYSQNRWSEALCLKTAMSFGFPVLLKVTLTVTLCNTEKNMSWGLIT